MHSGNVTEQVEGIREQSVAVLEDLIARAGEFELADPPAALVRYRQKLRENAYKVLVVGKAKKTLADQSLKLVSLADTFRSKSDRPQTLHTVLGSS
jgi:hypothetical protein